MSSRGSWLWALTGMAVGAVATAALVYGATQLIEGDAAAGALGPPRFVEESDAAGVRHVYDGEFHYFVGGGVAVFDCDADHKPELYLAGGAEPAGLFANHSPVAGELRFERIADQVTDMTGVTGAYPIDVDSDGHTDLAVLRLGENVMLRGLGDCDFERANELWGVDGGHEWTAAFSATWEEGAALPTLAFGNYLALTDEGDRAGGCSVHYLFRPEGERYSDPITLEPGWCTLSVLFSDWNDTGSQDLRMTNDRHYYSDGEEQLWRIEADEAPAMYDRDDGWRQMQIWGMGIASQDLTGDGLPEVFLTSQGDNKLQTLATGPERPEYEDIALQRGANAHRPFAGDMNQPSTAWHAEFDDLNNDGHMDLFVTKGNVEAMPEFAGDDPNNLLLGQPDGTFVEAATEAGLLDFERSRGAALADLNLDGLLDVVVVDRRETAKLWRNVGSGDESDPGEMGNWLAITLRQPAPNLDSVGAWVDVRSAGVTTRREITIGGGHAGGQLGWAHFGLGDAGEAEIRVQWPDGENGPWMSVDANQFVVVRRGASSAEPWDPVQD